MTHPLVGLGLVDVVDVDEHDLEASDISQSISLEKLDIKHVSCVFFI